MNLHFFIENLLFFTLSTVFCFGVGWAWRKAKPYELPQPFPSWFKIWFLSVQMGGGIVPLIVLIWAFWRGNWEVGSVLLSYFVMLGLQILAEILSLRWFRSVVWVMVPYLYLPYRFWQLYEGWMFLPPTDELIWIRGLLLAEIGLWVANYALDLSQLPRLLRWEVVESNG